MLFEEYKHDYAGYCHDVLGMPTHEIQDEMGALVDTCNHVGVYGCHSSTKSHGAASIVSWWVDTRDPAWVVTTAPGGRQVRHGLWRTLGSLRENAKVKLPGKCLTQQLQITRRRMALGFTSRYGDACQGLRESSNVLVIEDEATSVDDSIHESLVTLATVPGSCYLMMGNPTAQSGHFRQACTKLRYDAEANPDGVWHCLEIDGYAIVANPRGIPGVISQEYINWAAKTWGIDSPIYLSRIRGRWVEMSGANLVVSHAWVREAQARWKTLSPAPAGTKKVLLADVGASQNGDPTAVYVRHGQRIWFVSQYWEENVLVNAARLLQLAISEGVAEVRVDATGVGKGVWQELERLVYQAKLKGEPHGEINVVGVQLGDSANVEGFHRLLSYVQWQMRLAFSPEAIDPIAIDPTDHELAEQLSWRTWELDENHKILVESKKRLRKRTGKSPDKADAVMLAFYDDSGISWFSAGKSSK